MKRLTAAVSLLLAATNLGAQAETVAPETHAGDVPVPEAAPPLPHVDEPFDRHTPPVEDAHASEQPAPPQVPSFLRPAAHDEDHQVVDHGTQSPPVDHGPTPAADTADAPPTTRPATSGAIIELPPDQMPQDNYSPDWSRYTKAGLFGGPSPNKITADETPDLAAAEAHFLALLNMPLPSTQRRAALLDLAAIYQNYNIKPKLAATYERYIEVFPQDPMIPEIYMRLGFLYREIGSFKMALNKFYSVLNASLAMNREQMDTYRQLSLKAQIEIADTYYVMGDYDQAAKFFLRLKRLDLTPGDRALVDFKYAYTQYLLEELSAAVTSLQAFLKTYGTHPLAAEAHFLLANAHKRMGQQSQALAETLNLLQYQEDNMADPIMWAYWKKRTGNQLANEFYEQGDYSSALRIYQAMAILSPDPEWQWPVVYQIGLCFERLRMATKSLEAYQLIISGADTATKEGHTLPPSLQELRQQAQWRLEHLQWLGKTEAEMNALLGS